MNYKKFVLPVFLLVYAFVCYDLLVTEKYIKLENIFSYKAPESRQMMVRAENLVKDKKPKPPISARFYGQVASKYYIKNFIVPKTTDEEVKSMLISENDLDKFDTATKTLESILDELMKEDNDLSSKVTLLKGDQYWNGSAPASPAAGLNSLFLVDDEFTYNVPNPPVYGGAEFVKALKEVKDASMQRTAAQSALINYWGGVPGTEQPAGIWQEKLWGLGNKYKLDDERYAYAQFALATSVADAFTICWRTKYTHQTKRPDMTDKSIVTSMANPPFPSYISGHSTISFAGAEVLSKLFPKDKESLISDAENAKNSRLWAGIHFPYDNEEGKKLGTEIGKFISQKMNLQPLVK